MKHKLYKYTFSNRYTYEVYVSSCIYALVSDYRKGKSSIHLMYTN